MRKKAKIAAGMFLIIKGVIPGILAQGLQNSTPHSGTNCTVMDPFLAEYIALGCSVETSVKQVGSNIVLNGDFKVNFTNGVKILEGSYTNGVFHGELLSFYPSGRLESRRLFDKGKYHGTGTDWTEDGFLSRTVRFLDGEKDGMETYWTSEALFKSRVYWNHGKPDWIEFYESGVVKSKITGADAMHYFRERALDAAKKSLEIDAAESLQRPADK